MACYYNEARKDIESAMSDAEALIKRMGKPHNNVTQETADMLQGIHDKLANALSALDEVEMVYNIETECNCDLFDTEEADTESDKHDEGCPMYEACAECERQHGPNYSGKCKH